MEQTQPPLQIAMLLYPGLTLLDLIGPATVFSLFANIHRGPGAPRRSQVIHTALSEHATPDAGYCWRSRSSANLAVEVNHIVIPAKDKLATARLLAYVLGLEIEYDSGPWVRIRTRDGLMLDFSAPEVWRVFQCAFLVGGAEFDGAVGRLKRRSIEFQAAFDGSGRGEINRLHGGRGIYFEDPNGHLFELIEQLEEAAPDSRIRAVAIKCAYRGTTAG